MFFKFQLFYFLLILLEKNINSDTKRFIKIKKNVNKLEKFKVFSDRLIPFQNR